MKSQLRNTYLPPERSKILLSLLHAIQHVMVLFPSTVLVALLTGFPISTTLIGCGISNIIFVIITKRRVPLLWGASFAFIPSISSITCVNYGIVATDSLLAVAEIGIIGSAVISVIFGFIVIALGNEKIQKIIPPVIAGSVAIVIGTSLAVTAVQNIFNYENATVNGLSILIASVTLFTAIIISVYLRKRAISNFSILFAIIVGYLLALLCQLSGYKFLNETSAIEWNKVVALPHFVFPWQADSELIWIGILSIIPVAIITLPETVAHVYQADMYVEQLSKSGEKQFLSVRAKLGMTIVADGLIDAVGAMFGCVGTTSYGENLSVMSISQNYSFLTILSTAVLLIILSFFNPLIGILYSIPKCVIGAISIYLFGMIVCQGLKLLNMDVDIFEPKNIVIISVIIIIGIGGLYGFENGMIPLLGIKIPAIALASVIGIIINALFTFIELKTNSKNK